MNSAIKTSFSFLSLVLSVLLAGCISTSTQMVNDKGQVANCGATGFGLIGAPAAYGMSQDCINKHQAAGFRETGAPSLAATSTTTATTSVTTSTSPVVVQGKDGFFKITLPSGWRPTPPPSPSYQLSARNELSGSYLLISAVNSADVSDWVRFTENLKNKLVANLTDPLASDTKNIKVNGFDALRTDIAGTLKNGLKVHYLGTVLKTDKNLVYVLSWSTESRYLSIKGEMEQLPSAMQF